MTETFSSSHNLLFEAARWNINGEWMMFRVGTCHGLYKPTETAYEILAIDNEFPGNGHFNDVMEWFENSCKRDGFDLIIRELFSERFKEHLVEKRGFSEMGRFDLIKKFNK